MRPSHSGARDSALFVVVATVWGLNYLFVRLGLTFVPPLWLAALRAGVGALAVLVGLAAGGHLRGLSGRDARDAALIGVPNTGLFFGLWFVAAASVPAGQTAVLVYTFPLWVTLLSGPVLGSMPNRIQLLAVAGGFAGVVLVSQPWLVGGGALAPLAVVELLAGSISWAVGTVLFKRRFTPANGPAANGFQLLGGAVVLFALAPIAEGRFVAPVSGILLLDVLWLGVTGTALAYSIWFVLLTRTPAATLSGYTFLVPLVALGASIALVGERLDLVQGLGVVLVLLAVYGNARGSRDRALPPLDPARTEGRRVRSDWV
jgi:O-acetylserine/cysteine efflux transporter